MTGGQSPQRLVGVGVGPGDPELVTLKAVRVLQAADAVLVPVLALDLPGRAEAVVREHVDPTRVQRVVFALNERDDSASHASHASRTSPTRRERAWDAAGQEVAGAFAAGASTVAFATIGDPNLYATFTYLAQTVRSLVPGVAVETVPGITAMQYLAARSGTVLCEGTETLALLPLTAGVAAFREALARYHTVVAYKGGRRMPEVLAALRESGRLDDAMYGAALGLPGEDVRPARELDPHAGAPYLSTIIAPSPRGGRGDAL